MPYAVEQRYYVRLHLHRTALSDVLDLLNRSPVSIADFGIGTAVAPKDYWVEIRCPCGDSKELLECLSKRGIPVEAVRDCRLVQAGDGALMARQLDLW